MVFRPPQRELSNEIDFFIYFNVKLIFFHICNG